MMLEACRIPEKGLTARMLCESSKDVIERHYLSIEELRLSYLERGTATEGTPSVIVLHGLMGCADTFIPLLQEFSPGQHVIALDFPGAGGSDRSKTVDASLSSTAELMARVIKALGVERPIVMGHSHGGAVAMSLAARHRDLPHSIVLLAPAHPWFGESDPIIRFYLSLPGRLFAHSMPWYPEWMQLIGLRRMAGPKSWDTPERLRPYRENLRTPGTMGHLLRLLRTWHSDMAKLSRTLRKKPLKVPALLIWGDSDRAVPVHSAERLRQNLGHSELIVLPGVGHRPGEESPALVASLAMQWIEADLAGSSAQARYSEHSVASQSRIALLMTPSFEAGD
jgi:pimeloyl-ACP methyl ester carboxylesterase